MGCCYDVAVEKKDPFLHVIEIERKYVFFAVVAKAVMEKMINDTITYEIVMLFS
jgi:hypothetical protein